MLVFVCIFVSRLVGMCVVWVIWLEGLDVVEVVEVEEFMSVGVVIEVYVVGVVFLDVLLICGCY